MSHWDPNHIICRACSAGSLMTELGRETSGFHYPYIYWCPLCGSVAKIYDNEPISSSDFIASYVAFDKESCCRSPLNLIKKI